MRISGKGSSSVILDQTISIQRLKKVARQCQKQTEAKRDGVINHKIRISIYLNTEKFDALKMLQINRSRP